MKKNSLRLKNFFAMTILLSLLSACAKPEEEKQTIAAKETPVVSEEIKPAAELPVADEKMKLPEPSKDELRSSIQRLYKDVLITDEKQFVVGDFNGDTYQDVAVVVKPMQEKLSEINSEVANWILEDPNKIPLPDPTKAIQPISAKLEPVVVESKDVLIAVIHGYGQSGWRSAEAIQTYLLKNAVGNNMKTQAGKEIFKEMKAVKNLPLLNGDVIRQTLAGKQGFLYFTGAKYVWRSLDL